MRVRRRKWQVYILQCKDGSLYTGMTCDIERRYKEHVRGSSRYTLYNPPVRLLYTEDCHDRPGALKRECQIKSWPRAKKLALISGAGRLNEAVSPVVSKRKRK
ncbi:MAG TPA: GIY-YIG nuclease family protein [Candidatus Omnitrophota bacterium]|nr:GIY-YIG nuclease family protein [Candidatus Omnitrophota bacterium]